MAHALAQPALAESCARRGAGGERAAPRLWPAARWSRTSASAILPGEVHCLVGPSGCGKTTILRLIAGLEPLQGGRIVIDRRGGRRARLRRGAGGAPGRADVPGFRPVPASAACSTTWPSACAASSGKGRKRRARELLAQVDMAGHAESYPHMLSGGEQQRVALARALAPRPRLMLLDEPFSSLDATLREHVREDAIAVLRATGTPVLMVTHEADEAVRVADQIHVMLDGRILQSGTPAAAVCAAGEPVRRQLLRPAQPLQGLGGRRLGQHAARSDRGGGSGRRHAGGGADPARGAAPAARRRGVAVPVPRAAGARSRHQPRARAGAAGRPAADGAPDQRRRVCRR